jgi:hypothetical protein
VIPPAYVHDWKQKGLVRGKSELTEDVTLHDYFKKATHEGGPRNGVLTAIEDFLQEHKGEYRFFRVHAGCGLGVMQYRGGLRDRLMFVYLRLKGLVCNVGLRALQFTRGLVPSASGKDSGLLRTR